MFLRIVSITGGYIFHREQECETRVWRVHVLYHRVELVLVLRARTKNEKLDKPRKRMKIVGALTTSLKKCTESVLNFAVDHPQQPRTGRMTHRPNLFQFVKQKLQSIVVRFL